MNREPDPTLLRDLFATSAAALRRKTRRRRQATISATLATFLAALGILMVRPGLSPDLTAPAFPSPSPVAPSPEPIPAYQTLQSDQELLAALADQGPMLITHSDGRKQLILTRPR